MDGGIVLIEQPHTSRGSLMVGREKQCIPRVYSPRLIGTGAGDPPVSTTAAVAGPVTALPGQDPRPGSSAENVSIRF
ncbi:hypothetical protein SMC3_05035 [Candidatus Cryosericum hinesii]|uniref:Uncharacterized protein n=2 Tax=Candidatus Cryosericum TaxID=2498709 RepID=A0A398DBH4_9BACT|nr:hypothetical protein SMC4_05655 [Candidatus Cryosericum hinesii]RIE10440.1 hypothetical protein SMC5_05955 [Candidatus Cryosericum odellii]RIE11718.1 hypothetical protein SMC2_08560 [Candidatus Cryosericum hinesii]RIE12936.1 hypothetical protein SMC3_05035 [Candidatus Cryosericum hinesii]